MEEARRHVLVLHPSSEMYGSDQVCLAVVARVVAEGALVTVLLPGRGPLVEALLRAGARTHDIDPLVLRMARLRRRPIRTVVQTTRDALRLVRVLRVMRDVDRPDCVYASCAVTLGGPLAAFTLRSRLVWHVHEIFRSPYQRLVFGILLSTADVVVGCSESVADQVREISRHRVPVISAASGVSSQRLAEAQAGPARQVEPGSLVCVGRLNSWKGQDVLIRALAQIRHHGGAARLTLVGGEFDSRSEVRASLMRLAATLGVATHVEFVGEVQDPLPYLRNAHVAIFPSSHPEPFGIALVEAMAVGSAVVATQGGGHSEIIRAETDGLLVPPGDADALAAAVMTLLADRDMCQRVGARAAQRATEFTLDKTADTTWNALRLVFQ